MIFSQILNDSCDGEEPKDAWARPFPESVCDDEADDTSDSEKTQWLVKTCTFSPHQLGAPTNRTRTYSFGLWLPYIEMHAGKLPEFIGMFGRPLQRNASIYLDADPLMAPGAGKTCGAKGLSSVE